MKNFSKLCRFTTIVAVTALVFAGCLSYSVDSVEVSIEGNATTIDAGKSIQFNFLVNASGKDTSQAQRVNWSVSSSPSDPKAPVTAGTIISPGGTLSVSADEIYPTLYVRATHAAYSSKYDFKQIEVKGPKVGSVVLSSTGNATAAAAGGILKLNAFVAGKSPNVDLTYSVGSRSDGTGAVVAGTAIAADGTLTVSANETASSLYVKAVSTADATKFAIKEIKVVTITSVTVSAEGGTARVLRGGNLRFTAAVAGNNNPANTVTWKVSTNAAGTGELTSGTAISANGTLTVAATEAATTLYVIATSTLNTAKSGSIAVTIPTVTAVTVSPTNPTIKRGEGVTFSARVQGTGNPGQEVTWKLDGIGGAPSATAITGNGMLIVSPAETLSGLIVTATSVDDPAKFGTSMITIPATPAATVSAAPPPAVSTAPAATSQATTPATTQPGSSVTTYTITGSGTSFSALRSGTNQTSDIMPIQDVIYLIKSYSNGAPCRIQFGDGATALNIGNASLQINSTNGNWGALTLSGKISGTGTIFDIAGNVSVTSDVEISNTSSNNIGIFFNSTGTLNITGGRITTGTGKAVQNNHTGTVNITGGTFLSNGTNGVIVQNNSTGTLNISGGTIQTSGNGGIAVMNFARGVINITGGEINAGTTSRAAVLNTSTGRIRVSGTAAISSGITTSNYGTIILLKPASDNNDLRFEMTGGTVTNSSSTTGNAIWSNSTGPIYISGGTVSAWGNSGYAIYNLGGADLNFSGARIEGRVGP